MDSPLKVAREKKRLTQRAAADLVGIDPSFYGRLENLKARASTEVAGKLATAFGISEMMILYPERYMTERRRSTDKPTDGQGVA